MPDKLKNLLFCLLIIALSSCNNTYSYWPVEHFHIDDSALADKELVEIIYYSDGPLAKDLQDGFYHHAVVISSSKDTINVLTYPNLDLNNISKTNTQMVFYGHPRVKNFRNHLKSLPQELKGLSSELDTANLEWVELDKVARNTKFDYIADNHYPTVIGGLQKP
tara:strand:- start:283 stop:774 length:492 start_codon:yes stop_codon:yes gene_type:complete